jgi:hypothetical protein
MVGIQGFDVWVAFVQLSLDFFPLSVLYSFIFDNAIMYSVLYL